MNKCGCEDCFNCPYADCILNYDDIEVEPIRGKRGRKKLPPEEKKARARERERRRYYSNLEYYRMLNREKYYRKKERQKQAI